MFESGEIEDIGMIWYNGVVNGVVPDDDVRCFFQ